MANTSEVRYPAHLNLMITDEMDADVREAAHELRVPMAEFVRRCIGKELVRRDAAKTRKAARGAK